ncbi:hypothetical protein BJX63DRAFT_163321 [Aspergillus granulosus]|uniref:Ribosomal protein S21 n=1 Tax=Aspergillus granulosus TaxID=176169 RepID=A0ABR4HIH9_9EURO
MEMRCLTRSLRVRPTTTSLLYTRQYQRSLLSNQTLRFSSNSSSSSSDTPAPSHPPRSSEPAPPSEKRAPRNAAAPKSSPFRFKASNATSTSHPKDDRDALGSINGILDQMAINRPAPAPATTNPMKKDMEAQRAARLLQEPKARFKVNLNLGPTLGRTVEVDPGNGVRLPDAIRRLQSRLNANNVKFDFNSQRHHVRKGMVKKTLRRRRWRKLFKFSFQHTLAKVERMRKQGW